MTEIYATVDVVPGEGIILGTTVHDLPIELSVPIVIQSPIFGEHGVEGLILDLNDKRRLKGLKPVTRSEDGSIYTFDGRYPLLTAAYAFLHPYKGVSYTNNR